MWNKQPNNFQGQLFLPFKNSKSRKSQKSILHKLKNDICIQRSFLLDLELLMVLWFTRVMSKVDGQGGSVWTWVTVHFNQWPSTLTHDHPLSTWTAVNRLFYSKNSTGTNFIYSMNFVFSCRRIGGQQIESYYWRATLFVWSHLNYDKAFGSVKKSISLRIVRLMER